MDRETRARVDEAKRELADVLQTLSGRPRPDVGPMAPAPTVVFTGSVTIAHFVQFFRGGGAGQ